MKRITYPLLVICAIVFIFAGCEKEVGNNDFLLRAQSGCNPVVFRVMGWYSDSIFYTGNKISRVNKYYLYNSTVNSRSWFEYSSNQVKIYVGGMYMEARKDGIYYSLSYKDSRISQLETNSGRARANYFYAGNNLKYILYYRKSVLSDSLVVQYDAKRKNIAKLLWYYRDQKNMTYRLADSYNFTHDDKINPQNNSIHFLYSFYDCGELSLNYFNLNNIKSIKSALYDIQSTFLYNENNYPISVIYTSVDAIYPFTEIERDDFFYQCN